MEAESAGGLVDPPQRLFAHIVPTIERTIDCRHAQPRALRNVGDCRAATHAPLSSTSTPNKP